MSIHWVHFYLHNYYLVIYHEENEFFYGLYTFWEISANKFSFEHIQKHLYTKSCNQIFNKTSFWVWGSKKDSCVKISTSIFYTIRILSIFNLVMTQKEMDVNPASWEKLGGVIGNEFWLWLLKLWGRDLIVLTTHFPTI